MEINNKVLKRQLKKAKINDLENIDSKNMEKLLSFIEDAYENMDSNVYRLERALEISTSELREFNDNLEEKIQKELERNREKDKKLLEQSRYAAMGEMIANIAHQWRQPLSAISSTSTSMQLQLQLGLASNEEVEDSFKKIVEFTSFLTQTIEDFRGYLKEDKEKSEFDLKEVFNRTANIIKGSYDNNSIKINMNNYEYNTKSYGLINELSQVFLNILNNAKDALLENSIEEKRVYIEFVDNGKYNCVNIIDNAGGVPNTIIEKIFDPYFTTKHKSQGTGIGLYMSKDIIKKNMKGELAVENIEKEFDGQVYKGACFSISIPKKL